MQKKKYDRSWYNYIGKKLQKANSNDKEIKVNDIVNMFFGGNLTKKVAEEKQPIKGENIEVQIDISVKEAFEGTHKKISFNHEKNKIIEIDIKPGIKNGEKIRLEGKGKSGKNGGKDGDILAKINIINSGIYKLINDDIYINLYVTPWRTFDFNSKRNTDWR